MCDIREEDQVAPWSTGSWPTTGSIDVLVNNAGGQYMSPAEAITPKGFRTVIRLNVEGTWLMTHAVATRAMIPQSRGGRIINVTLSPHTGLAGMAHSSAARAAVENLTRVLAIEWARYGIRLNALAAGHFDTDTFAPSTRARWWRAPPPPSPSSDWAARRRWPGWPPTWPPTRATTSRAR